MNQAAPATIFNGLMERALELLQSGDVNQMVLKRLEREANSLERADPSGMYEVRAYISAIEGDFDSAHAAYGKALRLTDDLTGCIVRYLSLLSGSARTDDVIQKYHELSASLESDVSALRIAESALVFAGWCEEADKINKHLQKMGVGPSSSDLGNYPVSASRGPEVTEADVAHAIGFTHRFLMSRGHRAHSVQSFPVPHEDGTSVVHFRFGIDVKPDVVADLEDQLFGALDEGDLAAEKEGFLRISLASRKAEVDANLVG